jgi:DNA-binding winged helix-turn-helix (wHTH) protein/tetratricopeptide (TPR) repeat protein
MDASVVAAPGTINLASEAPFRVGGAAIDPLSRDATFKGGAERLQPQNLKVLILLTRRKAEVVTREQLIDQCWDGRFIGDDVINRAISTLRGFAARAGGFRIETVPKAGYRLVETPQARLAWRRRGVGTVAIVALLVAASGWLLFSPPSADSTLAVEPVSSNPTSVTVAREIGVRLAAMQSTNLYGFRVMAPATSPRHPDLVLQVNGAERLQAPSVDLALIAGRDKSILWAGHFQQSPSGDHDIAGEAAIAATLALSCALDVLSQHSERMSADTLRLYINGCARLAGELDETAAQVIPVFQKVIGQAPRFAAAWDQLLYAEALAAPWERDPALFAEIRRHLQTSRGLGIDVESTAMAEAALLPLQAYGKRTEVLKRGLERHPHAASLELTLADALMDVGRRADAMGRAAHAAALDPISPAIRGEYIWILAHSGRIQEARKQLEIAEELWPSAPKIYSVRLSFEVRYGNPRAALDVIRWGAPAGSAPMSAYAEARLDPRTDNVDRAISLGRFAYRRVPASFSILLQALAQFGRTDEALQELLRVPDTTVIHTEPFFRPMMRNLWRDPRFIKAMSRWGLVSYWRESGKWPDFCFDPKLPYDCKAEAAKSPKS